MKILIAIANYGIKNDIYLYKLMDEYKSLPHNVKIVILSNINKTFSNDIDVIVGLPAKDPWSLPFNHKMLFFKNQDNYDLFIYSEDDTLIRSINIDAFIKATKLLPEDRIAGFMRYEVDENGEKHCVTVHGPFRWLPKSIEIHGGETFAFFTNEHSACYILTRSQLKKAISSGGFMVEPHYGKYDLLCTAATDPYTQCGMKKLICISQIDKFLVHHLPNKYIRKMGLPLKDLKMQIAAMEDIKNGIKSNCELEIEQCSPNGIKKSMYEKIDKKILSLIPYNKIRLLSIGSEWGFLEIYLKQKGVDVTTIPIDNIISVAMEKEGIKVISPDLDAYLENTKDNEYDYVVLNNIIEFFNEKNKIIKIVQKALKNKGKVIIKTENYKFYKVRKYYHNVFKLRKNYFYQYTDTRNEKSLEKKLRSAGILILNKIYSGNYENKSNKLIYLMRNWIFADNIIYYGMKS